MLSKYSDPNSVDTDTLVRENTAKYSVSTCNLIAVLAVWKVTGICFGFALVRLNMFVSIVKHSCPNVSSLLLLLLLILQVK